MLKLILGSNKNVRLTKDEYTELLKEHGQIAVVDYIERLGEYIIKSGKNYPSHYETIKNWVVRDMEKEQNQKRGYGKYNNVYLTEFELNKLLRLYPDHATDYIDKISYHIKSRGVKYDNHYVVVREWLKGDEIMPANLKRYRAIIESGKIVNIMDSEGNLVGEFDKDGNYTGYTEEE